MYSPKKIHALIEKVNQLEETALAAEHENSKLLHQVNPVHIASARNLLHYLAFRTFDLREFQNELLYMAISSSSHSEGCVLNHLQSIKLLLNTIAGDNCEDFVFDPLDSAASTHLLKTNTAALFGASSHAQTKIMVTLPGEAASDYTLLHDLVKGGMNIARINTAHDNVADWENMVLNVKKAAKALRKQVKVYMDIEGPKLRTGVIKALASQTDKKTLPYILLFQGSKLKIVREIKDGHGGENPQISLTLPHVFDFVKKGERIWFDDGKLGGTILSANHDSMTVEITFAPPTGFKLKAEKGINFPDTHLELPPITKEDLKHLSFIALHADMVGFSFVQTADDVRLLQKHLHQLNREDMGIILKIETKQAFDNLPAMLFAAMKSAHCGIMIARGDLAIEIGFLRMAEVQEEILWLAEAAHMPVIWATQVLEHQVKRGIATRAEISDVVKSVQAECVMLNKGPYILEAMKTIQDIDHRMAFHQEKKWKMLRSLNVAKAFFE